MPRLLTQFGAFMEVLSGKDGIVHVSELAEGRVEMSRRAWLRDQATAAE